MISVDNKNKSANTSERYDLSHQKKLIAATVMNMKNIKSTLDKKTITFTEHRAKDKQFETKKTKFTYISNTAVKAEGGSNDNR